MRRVSPRRAVLQVRGVSSFRGIGSISVRRANGRMSSKVTTVLLGILRNVGSVHGCGVSVVRIC